MSIKALALEFYRAKQQVELLEKKLAQSSVADQDRLARELKEAQELHSRLRRIIDGAKDSNPVTGKVPTRYGH